MTKAEALKQIRAGKLAIKNDSQDAIHKCSKIVWPKDKYVTDNKWKYHMAHPTGYEHYCFTDKKHLPSIPATKLLKLLTNKQTKMKPKKTELVLRFSTTYRVAVALKYGKIAYIHDLKKSCKANNVPDRIMRLRNTYGWNIKTVSEGVKNGVSVFHYKLIKAGKMPKQFK